MVFEFLESVVIERLELVESAPHPLFQIHPARGLPDASFDQLGLEMVVPQEFGVGVGVVPDAVQEVLGTLQTVDAGILAAALYDIAATRVFGQPKKSRKIEQGIVRYRDGGLDRGIGSLSRFGFESDHPRRRTGDIASLRRHFRYRSGQDLLRREHLDPYSGDDARLADRLQIGGTDGLLMRNRGTSVGNLAAAFYGQVPAGVEDGPEVGNDVRGIIIRMIINDMQARSHIMTIHINARQIPDRDLVILIVHSATVEGQVPARGKGAGVIQDLRPVDRQVPSGSNESGLGFQAAAGLVLINQP